MVRISHALQAGLAAAVVGGLAGLLIGAAMGFPGAALPAAPAAFFATWLVWHLAFRTPGASIHRALYVGPASVVLAMVVMWLLIGAIMSVYERDLTPIPVYLVFAVFGLIYTTPLLFPLAIGAAYLVRRLQMPSKPKT